MVTDNDAGRDRILTALAEAVDGMDEDGAVAAAHAALEAGIPPDKRLAGIGGDCPAIISRIRDGYPKRTLFVVFQAAIQRGAEEILQRGRLLDLGSV